MKKAVLVVSFGTSYHETRKKTIELCERKISEELKEYDFYRAFTSNKIIEKLKKRDNIFINNPIESLQNLVDEGYEEVIVQTLYITCGKEYNKLKKQVESYEHKFKKILLGRPLLTTINDYKEIVQIIKKQLNIVNSEKAILFMGHGVMHKNNYTYQILESMFRNDNIYIGTLEGYPKLDQIIKRLKFNKIKTIDIRPFLLVSGKHVINDMAGNQENSWKTILEKEGFEVNINLHSLGEYSAIQDKFVDHALDCKQKL